MKKLVVAALSLALYTTAQAAELKTFDQISQAVSTGKQLTFVLKVKECESSLPKQDLITSIKPSAFMIVNNQRVTAAYQHFSLNQPGAVGEPTLTNGKYDINADGKVVIKLTLMKASDYSRIQDYNLQCELGSGLTVFE
ncbi:VirK family protein [Legionella sp. D16C41]|uniref:VirK family protein n=1 Tax=Legionella sp. D16C41 TaxID=3402688 RepID=UPI003AF9FE29